MTRDPAFFSSPVFSRKSRFSPGTQSQDSTGTRVNSICGVLASKRLDYAGLKNGTPLVLGLLPHTLRVWESRPEGSPGFEVVWRGRPEAHEQRMNSRPLRSRSGRATTHTHAAGPGTRKHSKRPLRTHRHYQRITSPHATPAKRLRSPFERDKLVTKRGHHLQKSKAPPTRGPKRKTSRVLLGDTCRCVGMHSGGVAHSPTGARGHCSSTRHPLAPRWPFPNHAS